MPGSENCVLEKTKLDEEYAAPSQYDVFMWNDDVTPMDAVVIILMEAFEKDLSTAIRLMLEVHKSDKGLVGTYSMEEAYEHVNYAEKLKAELNVPSFLMTVEEH